MYGPPERFRRQIKVLKGDEIIRLIEGYQSGRTVYELGPEFGIHRTTVGIILRRHGIATTKRELIEKHLEEILRLHAEGWSHVRIGQRFGLSETPIRNVLRSTG